MPSVSFERDSRKDAVNAAKHGVSFGTAQQAFFDPARVIARDVRHSTPSEERYFCFAKVGGQILTVRFTMRDGRIRIFGAGHWREGRGRYGEKGRLHGSSSGGGTSDS